MSVAEWRVKERTVVELLEQLRPYACRMEAKGIDCTYMRGKIAGLEIALEMMGQAQAIEEASCK